MNLHEPADGTIWPVEAWRGLAAWMVVYAHYWAGSVSSWPLLRFTFTGVDLFFVLSGFVFAPYFFGKPMSAGSFAVRRFFRIYPTYFLALLIYFSMKWLDGQALAYWWQHLVFAYLQSREMVFYYNPAFWSLPAEVEFYLLLPLLAIFCRRGWPFFAALALTALIMRLALGWASDAQLQNGAYVLMHHLPGMLIEFLLGVCAWALSRLQLASWHRWLLFAGGLAFWIWLARWFATVGDVGVNASLARGQLSWLAALAFAAMLAASVGYGKRAPQALVFVALWSGRLSFGIYLFHIAALRLLEPFAKNLGGIDVTMAAALLTLLIAWFSYRFWENPWRKFGRDLAGRGAGNLRVSGAR